MKKYVPRDKMSKKERKALNQAKRRVWDQPPVTKVIPNKKKTAMEKKPRPDQLDGTFLCALSGKNSVILSEQAGKTRIFG